MAKAVEKSPRPLKSKQNQSVNSSSSDADSAASSRTAKSDVCHVSLSQLAALLDRDRNTIMKWINKDGCPFVQRADRDLGHAWVLDVAAVVKWLESRAAEAAAGKAGIDDNGRITEDEAKRRRAVAHAVIAEVDAAEKIGEVARVSEIADRIADDYSKIRTRLMKIPDSIAGRIDHEAAQHAKEIADEEIREALRSLKVDKEVD